MPGTDPLAPSGGSEAAARMLPPGSWLGVLGGGQLGRMFCHAAQSLGYRVAVLDPDEGGPAADCADRHIRAAYDDEAGLAELARQCQAVTTEFENVPAASLEWLARHVQVSPSGAAVRNAQDRRDEKRFIRDCGVAVAPYLEISDEAGLAQAQRQLEEGAFRLPAILKAARLGYDGKGQVTVASTGQLREAYLSLGSKPCVLEQRLELAAEISVIIGRGFDGQCSEYPVAENVHRQGILATTTVPATVPGPLADRAVDAARVLAHHMDYVGVLCVEFFVLADGSLVVNEMAPRPHNSGHYTLDAVICSQFEQQVRILAGLPLGSTQLRVPCVMLNLLGDCWYNTPDTVMPREPDWRRVLIEPQARLHLYGKREARRARKMGHLTVLGNTAGEARQVAGRLARVLGIPGA